MPKHDYLIQLIKTLSPSERRYFKLFSDLQAGEKKYMQLFELLENKEVYNAALLGKELGISAGQLAVLKHYLNQVLLKSMLSYKEESIDDTAVINGMLEADELARRGLYEHALETANKAIAKANEIESVAILPRLLQIKRLCLFQLHRYSEVTEVLDEYNAAALSNKETIELSNLYSVIIKFEQSRLGSDEFTAKDHPLLKIKPAELILMKSQFTWFGMMAMYYVAVKQDSKALLKLSREGVDFFEANPKLKAFSPYHYFLTLLRLATSEGQAFNLEKSLEVTEKCIRLFAQPQKNISKPELEHMRIFVCLQKTDLLTQLGRYEEALPLAQKVYEQRLLLTPYEQYSASFTYANILLQLKKSGKAIDKLDELLKINTNLRTDLQIYIRPLMILAQFDLGNYELVPYLIKSAKVWMKRRKLASQEVEVFFSLFNAASNATAKKRGDVLQKLLKAVKDGRFTDLSRHINLKDWVEGRLAGMGS